MCADSFLSVISFCKYVVAFLIYICENMILDLIWENESRFNMVERI